MRKISIAQKFFLIIFGIFLCVFLLEIGLRLGGFIILSMQEYRNKISIKQKGTYRIMCLGESTTEGQYPTFLQEILNKSNIGIKFFVIDKGVTATNTSIIASQLEEDIRKYSPDTVVAMIGINDGGIHMPIGFNRSSQFPLISLKVYKLARLLLMHIQNKIAEYTENMLRSRVSITSSKNIETPSQNNFVTGGTILDTKSENTIDAKADSDIFYIELGKQLTAQGQIDSAKQVYKKAVELNSPDNTDAYFLLALLSDPMERKAIFKEIFNKYKKLMEIEGVKDVPDLHGFCSQFVEKPEAEMYLKELEELLKKNLARNPKRYDVAQELVNIFLKQQRYSEAEEILKSIIKLRNDMSAHVAARFLDYFAILYHDIGRFALSEYYLREAHKIRPQYYSKLTINNYKKIKAILDVHKIKLVCVQYPLRSIVILKEIFNGENNIIFIDNESSFKNALKKMSYKDLFRDFFAGDFGHCTHKGNRLLAENIANAISKEIFNK